MSTKGSLGVEVTVDTTNFVDGLKKVETTTKRTVKTVTDNLTGMSKVVKDTSRTTVKETKKSTDAIKKLATTSDESYKKIANSSTDFLASLTKIYLGYKAIETVVKNIAQFVITPASDLEEFNNLLSVIGSQGGQQVIDQLNKIIDLELEIGAMSELMAKKTLASYLTIFDGFGFGIQQTTDLSENLVQLTRDFASFYNLSFESAREKLTSGLTGEIEPLKRLGIAITDETVNQYALAKGIKQGTKELTQREKVLVRLTLIQNASNSAQGDFVRTQDQFANVVRRTQTALEDLALVLGVKFLPLITPIVEAFRLMVEEMNYYLRTVEKVPEATTKLESSFVCLADVGRTIVVVFKQVWDLFTDIVNIMDISKSDIDSLSDAWKGFSIILETTIDVLKYLIVGLIDGGKYIATFIEDVKNMATLKFDFSETEKSMQEWDKRLKENFEDIFTIDSVDFSKQLEDKLAKESKKQQAKVEYDASIGLELKDTDVTNVSKGLKSIETDLARLRFEAERVNEGFLDSAITFIPYYDKQLQLQELQLKGSRALTKNEEETLKILDATLPIVDEKLKANYREVEVQEIALGLYTNIRESLKENIIASQGYIDKINEQAEAVKKYYSYLKEGDTISESIAEIESRLGGSQADSFTQGQLDILYILKEQEESRARSLGISVEQLNNLDKKAKLEARVTYELEKAVALTENSFDVIESGITGEGLQESLTSTLLSVADYLPPIASAATKAVIGVVNGIINLALLAETTKTKSLIAEMELSIIDLERASAEAEIQIDFMEKALSDLQGANDIEQTKRETARKNLESELIKSGKTELEIKEELRKFDAESSDLRISQIKEEIAEQDRLIQDLQNKYSKKGINIINPDGSVNEEALEQIRELEKADELRKNNLIALQKEIQQLSDTAGENIWNKDEKAAEAFAKRLKDLVGEDIFGNLYKTNFGQDDLSAMITRINEALAESGGVFTDEILDGLGGISDLENELANEQLEAIKKKKELEEGIVKDNLDRQLKYLDDLKSLLEMVQDSRLQGVGREAQNAINNTTSTIQTQFNYNIQSQSVGGM